MKHLLISILCANSFMHAAMAQNTDKPTSAQQTKNNHTINKSAMDNQSYTTTLLVDQTPEEVYNAITNVRGWWSESVEGATNKPNTAFLYHFKDVHFSKIKIEEAVPGKKITWLILENHFTFTKDKTEWTGTRLIFDITKKGQQTQLTFTHLGLVPEYECFHICSDGWSNYISGSLYNLITTGKGQPNPKEGGFNHQLLEKYKNQQ